MGFSYIRSRPGFSYIRSRPGFLYIRSRLGFSYISPLTVTTGSGWKTPCGLLAVKVLVDHLVGGRLIGRVVAILYTQAGTRCVCGVGAITTKF